MSGKRQKNQLQLAFMEEYRGEAPNGLREGTETLAAKREDESPAINEQLIEEVCERENCKQALKRVKANKGSPGVDGMTVQQLAGYLKERWPAIREQLLSGLYKPQPVKRVEIPKPDGGVRKLGIPTVLDRFIQQAVLQILQGKWDRTFSEHSIFLTKLWISSWAKRASGGGEGAAIHRRRLPLGGGSGFGEVLRPGQPRQTDGKAR
jgi:RNA-directed DNA polymerase